MEMLFLGFSLLHRRIILELRVIASYASEGNDAANRSLFSLFEFCEKHQLQCGAAFSPLLPAVSKGLQVQVNDAYSKYWPESPPKEAILKAVTAKITSPTASSSTIVFDAHFTHSLLIEATLSFVDSVKTIAISVKQSSMPAILFYPPEQSWIRTRGLHWSISHHIEIAAAAWSAVGRVEISILRAKSGMKPVLLGEPVSFDMHPMSALRGIRVL